MLLQPVSFSSVQNTLAKKLNLTHVAAVGLGVCGQVSVRARPARGSCPAGGSVHGVGGMEHHLAGFLG